MIEEKDETNMKKAMRKEIAWGVFKVGGITFLITAIVPMIITIIFLVKYWSQIQSWTFGFNIYGELAIGIDLGGVIFSWLMICFPLTISNAIGKRLMYTNIGRKTAFIMPAIALGLVISFFFLGMWILGGLSNTWL